jgi:hypothetical protein
MLLPDFGFLSFGLVLVVVLGGHGLRVLVGSYLCSRETGWTYPELILMLLLLLNQPRQTGSAMESRGPHVALLREHLAHRRVLSFEPLLLLLYSITF